MAQFEFDYTEVNKGIAVIEADSREEAERLASELYYEGGVVWDGVEISYKVGWTDFIGEEN